MKKEISIEQAKQILEAENKAKVETFLKEYWALCEKHGFEIVAVPQLNVTPLR